MATEWFNGSVSGKPQTPEYLLPRMALTMCQPGHEYSLKRSCHQLAAREIGRLHDEDRLTSDHKIVMLGFGPTIAHTILTKGDEVVFDSLAPEGHGYDPKSERYFSATISGHLAVKHVIGVDDFFERYVGKLTARLNSGGPELVPR
ncbi:MAG TPA: hypothetical protein VFS88_05410 [Micavibrio sp.]|nr:hypothetical protein [Micavibrio sp.]